MPGSFGSLLGLLWVAALLFTGSYWLYSLGLVFGLACSVWFCGQAEKILGQTDPGSVVLDEIAAMPVCFIGWLMISSPHASDLADPSHLIRSQDWAWALAIFLAFRFFDIVKPWPVRQSQLLPGGWGVTVDDALAAVYVNLAVLAAWSVFPYFG